jgi:subtilisin family serine protease
MMNSGWKKAAVMLAVLPAVIGAPGAMAKSDRGAADRGGTQRFIIELQDPPLASFTGGQPPNAALMGESERFEATSPPVTGKRKLNVRSPQSRAYFHYLEKTHDALVLEAAALLGRSIKPLQTYHNVLNGMALKLTAPEAEALAKSPLVKSIHKDGMHHPKTDAGPQWIGANDIWSGLSGFAGTRGEGVVIGVIDFGINWESPSFADPGEDGYNYSNPLGSQLGLCSDPEVMCNNKLIGVYDFNEDDPDTEDVVEENTKGKDNNGHGSHVASTAAGNVVSVTINGSINTTLAGVAPHANLIAYRVCYLGEPPDPDGGGCPNSLIIEAIDQAVEDGVDVINMSLGSDAHDPWIPGDIPTAFLNARKAGIFAATSAGNEGPNGGSIGSPANAPWIAAVGNATSDRQFGKYLQNLSGGNTTPPGDLFGASRTSSGLTTRKIVHASDYGYPLCGTGEAELASTCAGNHGLSNPWDGQQPFNGEIVVCDRGTYGRIEKGKNVMLAGAGGFVLANTALDGESTEADNHCLPALHIGKQDGDELRAWLASGSNHMGSISSGIARSFSDNFGDRLYFSSSRGPTLSPVQDILKPDVIAPGTEIYAAWSSGQQYVAVSGTSMSSPHIAGAAALMRAVHPDWSVSQIHSALMTTSSAALARDYDNSPATPHERGAGRPQLGEAVNAGLYLDVTGSQFSLANPTIGGDPKNLNLPGLVDSACQGVCSFDRTVTDQMGGGNWTAVAVNFPAGVGITITPASFSLANGGSQSLNIEVDLTSFGAVGEWIYGDVVLSAAGSPDQKLTVAVFSSGGELPDEWVINDDRDTGMAEFDLSGLAAMPDATFTSGGLVAPTRTTQALQEDSTNDDAYNGGAGVYTVWHALPQGGLWLHAETLASSAEDLDLYVGRDDDGDGVADEEEQLCSSTSPGDVELCDIFDLPAGDYWILVQNWDSGEPGPDDATLISAAIPSSDDSTLAASGPGITATGESFTVLTSWSNVNALDGEQWLGAVGIGTKRGSPNNIGVIPVRFNRNGYDSTQTVPLMNGTPRQLALAANSSHEHIFIDIPPGVTALNISAEGASSEQNDALKIELFRQNFSAALNSPPFAQLPVGLPIAGSATGSGGNGPAVMLSGSVAQGRYFVKLSNTGSEAAAVSITASVSSAASSLNPHRGLWDFDRDISQGAEWNGAGQVEFSVWYAYDKDGQPTWYIASGPAVTGNIWTADLLRVTNDGQQQQEHIVGRLSITFISDNQAIYSYSLLGQSGFDSMHPNGSNTCRNNGAGPKSYTGHWYRGLAGLGGSTVLAYANAQGQVHYIFDASGAPRWILAARDGDAGLAEGMLHLLQFSGFCAVCTPVDISYQNVGDVSFDFSAETSGTWTLDFSLLSPLLQNINRADSVVKLSDTLSCE